jgi:hypothetical protein
MKRVDPGMLRETLSWVLLSESGADWTIADHIAREFEPRCHGAVDLLTSDETTLETLLRAKDHFKTLRMEGETAEDRRLGAHLYAAAIAAALVSMGERISRQRDDSLRRAFRRMSADRALPAPLRDLAQRALERLDSPRE